MVKELGTSENIFGDNIANVAYWDFSRANLNEESRINAITRIASVCYNAPDAINSDKLYNKLATESLGLPSSSFEFVNILLDSSDPDINSTIAAIMDVYYENSHGIPHILNYGVSRSNGHIITNLRAILEDYEYVEKHNPDVLKDKLDLRKVYNTEEECDILFDEIKTFLYNVDLPTRSQMVRHRVSWQELSRRYVSGNKLPFAFYISSDMERVISKPEITGKEFDRPAEKEVTITGNINTRELIDLCINHYHDAIKNGVKPQDARRIIPQAAYTQIWGTFNKDQLENFFKLRKHPKAQWEIRKVAEAMDNLINLHKTKIQ